MKNILFSTDVFDHYKNIEEMVENYIEAYNLSDEDVSDMSTAELEDAALNWTSTWVAEDADDQLRELLERLNQEFETFKVYLDLGSYRGRRQVMERTDDIEEFINRLINDYRHIDDIAGYAKSGKVALELRHHDATDVVQIVAMQDNKPARIQF